MYSSAVNATQIVLWAIEVSDSCVLPFVNTLITPIFCRIFPPLFTHLVIPTPLAQQVLAYDFMSPPLPI
jgi:hypothetical protein